MKVYLQDLPLDEANELLDDALEKAGFAGLLDIEELHLSESLLGRVLAEAIFVKRSSPHYHAAAMDGFALVSAHTSGASPRKPLLLRTPSEAHYVNTGDPMPPNFDAVVPIEETEPLDETEESATNPRKPKQIRIRKAISPWQHVRPMGEDMLATQLLLPAGHSLRPVDLAAIANAGHSEVSVARKPRVAILPTGSELLPLTEEPAAGEITESNSLMLSAQVNNWGGHAQRHVIVRDNLAALKEAILALAETADLVLVIAGSSAGSRDFVSQAVADLGDLLVHGVAVRPGHPVILGMINKEDGAKCPLIGVPGYPVSAAITGQLFVEPLLARWLGRAPIAPEVIEAEITQKLNSPAGDDDYVRVALARVGEKFLATSLPPGAGVLSSLVRADGLALLPRGTQGLSAGKKINVQMLRQPKEIENTILMTGSHDLSLDLITQHLAPLGRRLIFNQVGSVGGLLALNKGQAHLAGAHLLDPVSGEYNLPFIDEYLPGKNIVVLTLLKRQQGLIVREGNPKGLKSLRDLVEGKIRFVNRQRGSGTRILLDHHLTGLNAMPEQILGYEHEEYNHLAVAASVASERADAALGIAAAAQALDLEFIPLFEESFDLIIPQHHYQSELLSPLLAVLKDNALRTAIAAMPGYDVSVMGQLKLEK
jgi:putative molybdopterin biosynthesis protein